MGETPLPGRPSELPTPGRRPGLPEPSQPGDLPEPGLPELGQAAEPPEPGLPETSQAGDLPQPGQPGERFRHEVLAVVLRVRGKSLEALLWQRSAPPFEGRWSLPGGPLGASERLGTSAGRHLATKVDLTVIAHLEQLETRSDPERDPRGRVLATAYLALVSADVEPRIPADTAWHAVRDLPPTAFDHGSIVGSATERLRAKLSYTNIGFALAPETFTIAQLRDIYAASLGHPVSATNLQRILTRRGVIVATPAAARPTALGGRPATLYRFAARTLVVTNPFAAFRPPTRIGRAGSVPTPAAGLAATVP
jgi:8-oxo-dGTP diphosphatase